MQQTLWSYLQFSTPLECPKNLVHRSSSFTLSLLGLNVPRSQSVILSTCLVTGFLQSSGTMPSIRTEVLNSILIRIFRRKKIYIFLLYNALKISLSYFYSLLFTISSTLHHQSTLLFSFQIPSYTSTYLCGCLHLHIIKLPLHHMNFDLYSHGLHLIQPPLATPALHSISLAS